MWLKMKHHFSMYSITVQNLPSEDESIVIEHFRFLLQIEICLTQESGSKHLEEFTEYFHFPVR